MLNSVLRQESFESSARQISILRPEVGTFQLRTTSPDQKVGFYRSLKLFLRPEAGTFPQRMASSDRKLRICPRQIILNLPPERWYFRPPLNSVFWLHSCKLLLGRSQFSGQKLNLPQEEWHSPIGSWELLSGKLYWIFQLEGDSICQLWTESFD